MKIIYKALLVILILLIVLFFIFLEKENTTVPQSIPGTLQIIKSPWTGWNEKQPMDEVTNEIPEKAKNIVLTGLTFTENHTLTVLDVNTEEVHLEADRLLLKQGEAIKVEGINLMECKNIDFSIDFTIQRGEKVELNTCSMDAGVTWTITYVK